MTTGLFLAAAGCVVAVLAVESPRTTWPGVGLVLLGVPVYLVRKRAA